jgi:P4 family phage/plasmid primase-like protien
MNAPFPPASAVSPEYALALLRNGFLPVRLELGEKKASEPGWQNKIPTEATVSRDFARRSNIGLLMGIVQPDGTFPVCIDLDINDHGLIGYVERAVGEGCLKKIGSKGVSFIAAGRGEIKSRTAHSYWGGKKKPVGDILAQGKQTVIPPSIHPDTKLPYRWISKEIPENTPYSALPVIDNSVIDEILYYCKDRENPIALLDDMIWKGVGGGGDTHDSCVRAVSSMVARGWDDDQIHKRIDRAKREACERAGEAYDWPGRYKVCQEWIDSARIKEFGTARKKKAPKPSHGEIAEIVIEKHGAKIRWDRVSGSWYAFNGRYWEPNARDHVKRLIRQVLDLEQVYRAIIDGVEAILRTHNELWVDPDGWDPDRHLLNMPSGTLDLKTRQISRHDPDQRITMMARVSPDFDYHDSRWVKEMKTWIGDDPEELDYIHRLFGLLLTGETRDHCVLMWVGRSGTGKSKMAEAMHYVLGEYAQVARDTAFVDVRYQPHSEEIARMRGKRMVQIHEVEGSLNLQRVKSFSAGDRATACFKGKDSFEFTPVAKLWFLANEPPPTRSSGREMQRRLHVYEFLHVIADEDMDRHLPEALMAEAEKILGWAIDGAVKYYADGLHRSPHVIESSRRYFSDADIMEQWMEDHCLVEAEAITPVATLWNDFSPWADDAGIRAKPDKGRFSSRLKGKGFDLMRKALQPGKQPARCVKGLRLKTQEEMPIKGYIAPEDKF